MSNFQVAKKSLEDIQAVVTEALDNLDRLPPEEHPIFKDPDFTIRAVCHELLKKYQGHEPSVGDVLTFKTTIELALHNDYGVSTSKFE